MKSLGRVTNKAHNGLFVVICDARATYPGWDVLGEVLADRGSLPLSLGDLAGFVEEGDARYGGYVELFEGSDGVLWIAPAAEPDVTILASDRIESEPRTEVFEMGFVDTPSGTLTIALAYPALNMESHGDNAGLVHEEGERLDVPVAARRFALSRELTESGQILALRPVSEKIAAT
jgi:hypothetical protein